MSQAIIRSTVGATTKDFVVEGLLTINERKAQVTPPLPIPTTDDSNAVLTSVIGQTRNFTVSFLLLDRSDDYTNGTGSPGSAPYSIIDQKDYIMDEIFTPRGSHFILDEYGTTYTGRIQDIDYTRAGDDPYSDSVTITFARGIPF